MEKQKVIRLCVLIVLALALAASVGGLRGLFRANDDGTKKSAAQTLTLLSDAFVVPGVLYAGVGGLSYALHKNAYDGLGYMTRMVFGRFIPGETRKHISYYDYKQQKDAARRPWDPTTLLVGAACLVLGIGFTVAYLIISK